MRRLTVLFDGRCAVCRRARDWLASQPQFVPLEFLPAGGPEALRRYPALSAAETLEQLTVVADGRWVYRGHKAWLLCLWALEDYRGWSLRLGAPGMQGMAKRAVDALSAHRYTLSDLLKGRMSAAEYVLGRPPKSSRT